MNKILQALSDDLWCITEAKLDAIIAFVDLWSRNASKWEGMQAATKGIKFDQVKGDVVVLPLFGVISRRLGMLGQFSGGMSIETFDKAFTQYLNEPSISTIIIHVDSPGGTYAGCPEFAEKVYKARKKKQIIAVVDTLCASCAYWIASAANSIVMTPSSDVGSIGVFSVHVDESKAIENEGLKVSVFSAGKYKTELLSNAPISDDAKTYLQNRVEKTYDEFVSTVAKHRDKTFTYVKENFGEGRLVRAQDALNVGMVDRIGTLEEIVKELVPNSSYSKMSTASRAEDRKLELASRYPNLFKKRDDK